MKTVLVWLLAFTDPTGGLVVVSDIATEQSCHTLARQFGFDTSKRTDGIERYVCASYLIGVHN